MEHKNRSDYTIFINSLKIYFQFISVPRYGSDDLSFLNFNVDISMYEMHSLLTDSYCWTFLIDGASSYLLYGILSVIARVRIHRDIKNEPSLIAVTPYNIQYVHVLVSLVHSIVYVLTGE